MTEIIMHVKDLTTRFGASVAVRSASFTIKRGETLALVGESGSGKSVTALSIVRLLPRAARIESGRVLFKNRDLFQLTEAEMRAVRGKGISMIFQEPMTSLNPVLTVGEQIAENLPPQLKSGPRRRRVLDLLHQVDIPEPERRIGEFPHQLSGGMRQRVMIAAALAGEPSLLIADEPTTALDVTIQARILKLLKDLQQRTGTALLFITHDLALVQQMADHVAVMRDGTIVEQADRQTFFKSPQHSYSRNLFQVIPGLDKRGRRLGVGPEEAIPAPESDQRNAQTLLQVEGLKVYFPIQRGVLKRTVGHVKAVDGVSLSLYPGRTLALVGESGSGKTTVGKGILQLIRPTEGTVSFSGHTLTTLKAADLRRARRGVQFVFQDPFSSLNPRMLVGNIIEEGIKAQRLMDDANQRRRRVRELLDIVGLPADADSRYPHEFSGGQRQRIGIARALAVDPKLIICDEPTSALDVSVQAQILNLLQDLQREFNLAYLFITHNLGVVAYMAHEVAVMRYGRIVEYGETISLLQNPRQSYTRELLSAVPQLLI